MSVSRTTAATTTTTSTFFKRLRIRFLYLSIGLIFIWNTIKSSSSSNNYQNYSNNNSNSNHPTAYSSTEEQAARSLRGVQVVGAVTTEEEKKKKKGTVLANGNDDDEDESSTIMLQQHGFNIDNPQYTMDNYTYYVSNSTTVTPTNDDEKTICFIKCSYGHSLDDIDKYDHPSNSVLRFKQLSGYQFYYVTNIPEIAYNISKLGWDTLLLKDLPFKRQITQSRYGKFMSWKIPLIQQQCHTVFYLDGQLILPTQSNKGFGIKKTIDTWKHLSDKIRRSSPTSTSTSTSQGGFGFGLLQQPHKYDVIGEIDAINRQGKDTRENMGITLKWIIEQPSNNVELNSISMYRNTILGYDPTNIQYQQLSTEFWGTYSKEIGSWRDQLLWAYYLNKHNIKPIWNSVIVNKLTKNSNSLKGHGGHTYVNVSNVTITKNA